MRRPRTADEGRKAREGLFVVLPREAAKTFHGYDTDPEVLLACMIVSGTLDTSKICRTEIHLADNIAITDEDRAAYTAFRRVWSQPTKEETELVLSWAQRIYENADHRRKGGPHKPFAWKKGGRNKASCGTGLAMSLSAF